MTTIRKSLILKLTLKLEDSVKITERKDSFVEGGVPLQLYRVDTSVKQDDFTVLEDSIIIKPHIKIEQFIEDESGYKFRSNDFVSIPYKNDLQASVAYARAVEQLNNPNVEFVSF